MLKYMLLLCVVPVKNDVREGRIATYGTADEDDYPAFSTHNFTVYETGGFVIRIPLSEKHSLKSIYMFYTVNQNLTLQNMVRKAHTGVFIRDEVNCCWKYIGLSLPLSIGDEFQYILQLNGLQGNGVRKQYRKIIDKLLSDEYRGTGSLPTAQALQWFHEYQRSRRRKT